MQPNGEKERQSQVRSVLPAALLPYISKEKVLTEVLRSFFASVVRTSIFAACGDDPKAGVEVSCPDRRSWSKRSRHNPCCECLERSVATLWDVDLARANDSCFASSVESPAPRGKIEDRLLSGKELHGFMRGRCLPER